MEKIDWEAFLFAWAFFIGGLYMILTTGIDFNSGFFVAIGGLYINVVLWPYAAKWFEDFKKDFQAFFWGHFGGE